ncbi:MAG: ABC transporter substrate-binding protein [Magnetococcales bacterium]|nr:ABC transporter substrate-binding protein [Magnetococcales bacterium]
MKKTGLLKLFFIPLMALAMIWPHSSQAADPVKVGVVLPVTGKFAKFGEIEKLSFEMAQEEINAKGGVNGRPLHFLIEDTTSKPDVGRSAAEKLISMDRVVMLGGGYSSSVTAAVAGVAINKSFPFLVNTGSADIITKPTAHTPSGRKASKLKKGLKEETDAGKIADIKKKITKLEARANKEVGRIMPRFRIFRLNPPVSEYASGLESFLADVVKPKSVAILHENSLFGTKGAAAFEKSAKKLGIQVLLKESYDSGAVDFKPLLAKVKQADPELIYMVSYVLDASLLMSQSMELRMNPKLFVGGGAGFTMPEFMSNTGKAGEKVISATLWHESLPLPGAREYFDKFKAAYDRDTEYHGAEAYAAAYVIADVLKRAKSFSKEDITASLAATDMMTVFGPVKFTSYDGKINQNKLETYVVQWQDGALKMIWPKDLANAPYAYPVNWLEERK